MHPDSTSGLAPLPIALPLFFVESCGYRGGAQFVALKWDEEAGELWLAEAHGGTPWLLIDRRARTISLGNASEVWRVVHGQPR